MSNIQKHEASPVMQHLRSGDTMTKFKEVLGQKAPQFIASLISATQTNDKLLECKPDSLTGAALIAATLDLPINASLGMAYLVPYKSGNMLICQFQIGWKGLVQLAIRTGLYKTINVTEVYEGQLLNEDPFTGEYTFSAKAKTSDKVIGYVAYLRLLTGFEKQYYWTVAECEAHAKKYSKSYTGQYAASSLWTKDFDGMSKKTVLKLLLDKFGPKSVEMQNAIIYDQGITDEQAAFPQYPDNPHNDFTEAVVTDTGVETTISHKKQEMSNNITNNLNEKLATEKKQFKIPVAEPFVQAEQEVQPEPVSSGPIYFDLTTINDKEAQGKLLAPIKALGFDTFEAVLPTLQKRMINIPTKEQFLHHATQELIEAIKGWVEEDRQEAGL